MCRSEGICNTIRRQMMMDAVSPRKPTRAKRPWAGNMREAFEYEERNDKRGHQLRNFYLSRDAGFATRSLVVSTNDIDAFNRINEL